MIRLLGVFDGTLLMRVTTVASVTEQNNVFRKIAKAATTNCIRSLQPLLPHHMPSRSLRYTSYQQQLAKHSSRRVKSTSPNRDLLNKSRCYEVNSIATTSFAPSYTLAISLLYIIPTTTCETQQPTRTKHLPKTHLSRRNGETLAKAQACNSICQGRSRQLIQRRSLVLCHRPRNRVPPPPH